MNRGKNMPPILLKKTLSTSATDWQELLRFDVGLMKACLHELAINPVENSANIRYRVIVNDVLHIPESEISVSESWVFYGGAELKQNTSLIVQVRSTSATVTIKVEAMASIISFPLEVKK